MMVCKCKILKNFGIRSDEDSKDLWKQCPACQGYHKNPPCQTCKGTGIIPLRTRLRKDVPSKNKRSKYGRCIECGKLLTSDDAYGHDCERGGRK